MFRRSRTDQGLMLLVVAIAAFGVSGIAGRPYGTGSVAWLGLVCGFSFLVFSLICILSFPGRSSRVLAVVLLGCSLVFIAAPAFELHWLGSFFTIVRSGLVLTGIAAMLHFLLLFPEPGAFASQARNIRVLYLPAFLFWLLVSYRALSGADADSTISTFTYIVTGIIMVGYFLTGVIVFLRRYIRCPGEEQGPRGMRLMLWGSVAGFGPAVIGFMPAFSGLPGNEYYFLSMALLPPAWAMAAKSASDQFSQP